MTQRFRLALVALAALAALTGALWLLRGAPDLLPEPGRGGRPEAPPADPGDEGLSGRPPLTGSATGTDRTGGAGAGPATTPTGGMRPGLRVPEGVDLSDPLQRRAYLLELIGKRPPVWEDIAAVVAITTEPLDPAVLAFLLQQLRSGDRNGASKSLVACHDPALVPELLAIVDDATSPAGARRVALMALAQMPGAQRDELVKTLEARLTGTGVADAELLGVIARRGGAEAARAITEYLGRGGDAVRLAQGVVGQLDLTQDPAAAEVLAEALRRTSSPEALSVLVRLASARPGASAMAGPLIALDRDDVPEALRTQVLEALAQVGSTESTEHLLRVARQPGTYGERATLALANLTQASPEAADALLAELERSALNPRPEQSRSALLQALGTLRSVKALPVVVGFLEDRDLQVRNSALTSLGRMGTLARPHVKEVAQHFAGGSEATRIAVAIALGGIGGPEAATQLEELLKTPDLGAQLRRTLGFAAAQARGLPPDAEGGAAGSTR